MDYSLTLACRWDRFRMIRTILAKVRCDPCRDSRRCASKVSQTRSGRSTYPWLMVRLLPGNYPPWVNGIHRRIWVDLLEKNGRMPLKSFRRSVQSILPCVSGDRECYKNVRVGFIVGSIVCRKANSQTSEGNTYEIPVHVNITNRFVLINWEKVVSSGKAKDIKRSYTSL